MRRRWLAVWIIIGFIGALLAGVIPVMDHLRQQEAEQKYLTELKRQMGPAQACVETRQLNLAKWYNWNLRSEAPDEGFVDAYSQILHFQDGSMALLLLPEMELPIYHQGYSGRIPGAEHSADSALPIGGRGNRCVLHLPEGVTGEFLPDGEMTAIYCMGRILFYRVVSSEEKVQESWDLLILIPGDNQEEILLRRSDGISISHQEDDSTNLHLLRMAAAGGILFALLPVSAGICLAGLGRIRWMNRNHRKKQEKSEIPR